MPNFTPSDNDLSSHQKDYSEEGFWDKVGSVAKKAGLDVIRTALELYYVLTSSEVSMTDTMYIIGGLGYFISPIDVVPDVIPVVGYADDLAVLLFVVKKVKANITPAIKAKAQAKLEDIFGADAASNTPAVR